MEPNRTKDKPSEKGTGQKGRIQLFNANSTSSKAYKGFDLSSHSHLSDSSLNQSLTAPRKHHGSSKNSPQMDTPRSQRSIQFTPNSEPHSHHRKGRPSHSLADFLTPDSEGRGGKKKSPHLRKDDGATPAPLTGRKSGGKRSTDRKHRNNGETVISVLPLFLGRRSDL